MMHENRRETMRQARISMGFNGDISSLQCFCVGKAFVSQDVDTSDLNHCPSVSQCS